MIRRSANIRNRRPPPGTLSVIPTPIELTTASSNAAYDLAESLMTARRVVCEIESVTNLVDPLRVALSASRGLEVFLQISHDETTDTGFRLDPSAFVPAMRTLAETYLTTTWFNMAVEYADKGEAWWDRNESVLRRGMIAARQSRPGCRFCASIHYESARREGILAREIDRLVAFGMDAIAITIYPQLQFLDAASDERGALGRDYFDELIDTVADKLPIIISEAGWHTRHATGESDQAEFVALLSDMTREGTITLMNWFFLHDANNYPSVFGAYFSDMGLYRTDGTLKPAAHIFKAIAAAR